jgi:hypothetical protein
VSGQEPDQIRTRAIVVVGIAVVAITLALVGVAWLFVVAPAAPRRMPSAPSVLEHGLFEHASGGAEANARGAQQLEVYAWIDRAHHLARIPIERAIDAVVVDPALIGGHR